MSIKANFNKTIQVVVVITVFIIQFKGEILEIIVSLKIILTVAIKFVSFQVGIVFNESILLECLTLI